MKLTPLILGLLVFSKANAGTTRVLPKKDDSGPTKGGGPPQKSLRGKGPKKEEAPPPEAETLEPEPEAIPVPETQDPVTGGGMEAPETQDPVTGGGMEAPETQDPVTGGGMEAPETQDPVTGGGMEAPETQDPDSEAIPETQPPVTETQPPEEPSTPRPTEVGLPADCVVSSDCPSLDGYEYYCSALGTCLVVGQCEVHDDCYNKEGYPNGVSEEDITCENGCEDMGMGRQCFTVCY